MSDLPSDSVELSADDVRHIATLARIGMTDADVERFRGDLSDILRHFDALAAIDTEDVEPTMNGAQDLGSQDVGSQDVGADVMADDLAVDCMPLEDVLANAPVREGDYLRVLGVLDS